jgi:hypothetical protein
MKNQFLTELDWHRAFLCQHVYTTDWKFVYVNGMCDFDAKLESVKKHIDWGDEEVLLIYEESMFSKGAASFVITSNALYNIEGNLRLDYNIITNIELDRKEYKVSTSYGEYDFSVRRLNGEGTIEAILCVLREIIDNFNY